MNDPRPTKQIQDVRLEYKFHPDVYDYLDIPSSIKKANSKCRCGKCPQKTENY